MFSCIKNLDMHAYVYLREFEVEMMLAKLYKWCNEGARHFQSHDLLLLWVPPNDGIAH